MARTVNCSYLKKEGAGLDFPPYPGELGKRIFDNISKEAFELWKKHQTMLVNENRLNLADARARQYLLAIARRELQAPVLAFEHRAAHLGAGVFEREVHVA